MKPDYVNASVKAIRTLIDYNIDPLNVDPLAVLNKLHNVRLIAYGITADENNTFSTDQEAFTLVNKKDGKLQYIVIYNQNEPSITLRSALARELGHVILKHDGSSPEAVWTEEANCFAYHFLCPITLIDTLGIDGLGHESRSINFRPIRDNLHWELKEMQVFESMDDMKRFVVEERNKFNRAIGRENVQFKSCDVHFEKSHEYDCLTGWKNCFDIVLGGRTVGHCGE